jgi:imidazole glycerol-phosphate synthase subunit HisH
LTAPAPTIGVLDYGMGNRRSVQKALEHVGATALVTRDHDDLRRCDALVVPGVGAFPLAMRRLNDLGLADLVRAQVQHGVPLLGICLGMQLLFEHSEELEPTSGLGLIAGEVTRLNTGGLRVPHIGWNDVAFARPSALTSSLPPAGCPFYHVHSYAARPADPADLLGATEYGERFATIVASGNVLGTQFHPEKSSTHGLELLRNYVSLCDGAAHATATVRARA